MFSDELCMGSVRVIHACSTYISFCHAWHMPCADMQRDQQAPCVFPAGGVASQAETLINQQLARQAAEGAAAAASAAAGAGGLDIDMDSDESPPTVRLSLQLTQVRTVHTRTCVLLAVAAHLHVVHTQLAQFTCASDLQAAAFKSSLQEQPVVHVGCLQEKCSAPVHVGLRQDDSARMPCIKA